MTSIRKRIYQEEFLDYGFTQIDDKGIMKPQCVVCLKVLTAESLKKSQLKKHLDNLHPHLASKPREYFVNLEMSVKRQRLDSSFRGTFSQCSASKASFEVAWLIARNKKPYTIGEDLVKPAALKMAEIMCGQNEAKKLNCVPLSARVVKERVSILAKNVRQQVISSVKESKYFAIQLDETTDVSSNFQLMVYVRYKGLHLIEEELLFCSPLDLRSRGIDIFNKVNEYFNDVNLKWEDCLAVSVDGAPAMLGHVNGFVAFVRERNPKVEVNHCIIHRQALLVKHLEPTLEAVMHDVMKIVNVVKGHALNTRLFRELCKAGDAEYTDLLYHTEVRWLSRGNVLNRVWALKTELESFMVEQKHVLAEKFTNPLWVAHLAYLADMFEHVNVLNKELQGKNINIISAREKISAFGSKLSYWRQKVEQKKIATFSTLALFLEDCENITFEDIKDTVIRHLTKLKERFSDYSPDLDSHAVSWIVDPFKCEICAVPEEPQGLAESLLELRCSNEAQIAFENKADLSHFWMSTPAKAFKIARGSIQKVAAFCNNLPLRTRIFHSYEHKNKDKKSIGPGRLYPYCSDIKMSQY
ncbi:protein ZBED8-like [Pseudonaja textilis]|uniref:protein ZBED8-like n=1 Tax=Pseudonaja textilis TaxID=8673 RepID=UPI000EAA639F|nr:protein ZBED8-like [Pseudonaja textilis]